MTTAHDLLRDALGPKWAAEFDRPAEEHASSPVASTQIDNEEDEQKPSKAMRLAQALEEAYQFVHRKNSQDVYYAISNETLDRPILVRENGSGLRQVATVLSVEKLGTHSGAQTVADACSLVAARLALKRISTEERIIGLRSQVIRAASGGIKEIVIDLAEPNTRRVIVVDRCGWRVQSDHPEISFRLTEQIRPLPNPEGVTASYDSLWDILAFGEDTRERDLIRGWLINAFISDEERPMLFFDGPAGSGKTTRASAILQAINPPPLDGEGSPMVGPRLSCNIPNEQVKAASEYLVSYDNLGPVVNRDASDYISRLVTGDVIQKRAHYTNDHLFELAYKRTGILTGISIPNFSADAHQRLIPIHLHVITPSQRKAKSNLWGSYVSRSGEVLAAILEDLVWVIKSQRMQPQKHPRWAGFYSNQWRLDQALGTSLGSSYLESIQNSRGEQAHNDLLVQTVKDAVERGGGKVEASNKGQLKDTIYEICDADTKKELPDTKHKFADAITLNQDLFRAVGIEYRESRTSKSRTFGFYQVANADD